MGVKRKDTNFAKGFFIIVMLTLSRSDLLFSLNSVCMPRLASSVQEDNASLGLKILSVPGYPFSRAHKTIQFESSRPQAYHWEVKSP